MAMAAGPLLRYMAVVVERYPSSCRGAAPHHRRKFGTKIEARIVRGTYHYYSLAAL